jgi:hypothetical protein
MHDYTDDPSTRSVKMVHATYYHLFLSLSQSMAHAAEEEANRYE